MIRDRHDAHVSDMCEDNNKCNVILPESFFSLCGEDVRDMLISGRKRKKMCDCIIVDSQESRITLAELKSGKPNAGMVKHAKSQLKNGLTILAEILQQANIPQIKMQLILLSKRPRNDSVLASLKKPVINSWPKTRVIRVDCGTALPDSYTDVSVSDIVKMGLYKYPLN